MLSFALLLTQAIALDFRVVNTFPRQPFYTQGLSYMGNGVLLESNGMWGESNIRKTELTTGRVLVDGPPIPSEVFAEGAALHKGYVFQLTYMSRLIYVYDATTLRLLKTLNNPLFAEGWGLTSDGNYLIASDGSSTLYFLSSDRLFVDAQKNELDLHHTVSVVGKNGLLKTALNELEYIDGIIYANIYPTSEIVFIEAKTGKQMNSLNLQPLFDGLNLVPKGSVGSSTHTPQPAPEVVNGIASYVNGTLLVTGKYWPTIFQIALLPAPQQLGWPLVQSNQLPVVGKVRKSRKAKVVG